MTGKISEPSKWLLGTEAHLIFMKTEEIRNQLMKKTPEPVLTGKDFVSTGSTMLNLACTDHPDRGFAKGHYYLIVGTSRSGKTWLSLSCLAEAARNPNFKDYRFIYNNVEHGAMMDIGRYFGLSVQKRLKIIHSFRIEDFYDHLDVTCKKAQPFIYILDSMDALTSELEIRTFQKQKKARYEEDKAAGSYGDGKAKINSQNLRRAINPVEQTGSILIIINQTRDKLTGYGGKTHSGGNALQFYACMEIWSDIKRDLTVTYKKKEREQGTLCMLRVRKNRVSGKKNRTVFVPIYHTYGMDDVGSCVDYLTSEGHWRKKKGLGIIAKEFDFKGSRNDLIDLIVKNEMEKDLSSIAADTWREIEEAVAIKRRPRYV
jgi:RecA/RadA recombinase